MRSVGGLCVLLLLSGCLVQPDPQPSLLTQCSEPRPQVCTMEYAPVCAQLKSGSKKEYASGCNACADDTVTAYLTGTCS